ncbi:MAG: hypothetical protein KAJ19_10500 [Gammaproteobacteria bacterium]|nr:hypothetical protein [Gammaproteobacteria bacterium]
MTIPAVSEDIKDLLDSAGLTPGTDLFIMEWGKDVDAQTLILDSGGIDSDLKDIYAQPTFQILVRGKSSDGGIGASDQMRAIHEFLIARPTEAINGRTYLQFEPIGEPAPLGRDDNDRHVWSANYFTYRAPA